MAGFEPTASWTRTKRDTKLRHTPNLLDYYKWYSWKSQELFFPSEGNSFSIRRHFSIVTVQPLASWRRSVVRRSARTQFAAGRSKESRHQNRPAGDCSPAANRTAECRPYRAEPLLSIRKQFFLTRSHAFSRESESLKVRLWSNSSIPASPGRGSRGCRCRRRRSRGRCDCFA